MLKVIMVGQDPNAKSGTPGAIGSKPKTLDVETSIMYPEQIFMIQKQPAMIADGRFYGILVFTTGQQVSVVFKNEKEFTEFERNVNNIIKEKKND